MAFSHVPVALKMILQSGSIGKAAPSYGELCRFESGLCNRAPYTNSGRNTLTVKKIWTVGRQGEVAG